MTKKIDRVVAIDLGNGLANIRSVYPDGSPYLLTLPSAFGYERSIGEAFGDNIAEYDLNFYDIDGAKYVWGKDIAKTPNIIHTASLLEDRYETNNYKTFIKIVLGQVAKDIELNPTEQIMVSTGVPSNQTKESALKAITQAFKGEGGEYDGQHKVTVDDEEFIINVAVVTTTSQPLATVLQDYLDYNGNVKDPDILKMTIGVVDIGGGTTDLDTLDNFRRQNNRRSIKAGFRDVYKAIKQKINKENNGREIDVNDYVLLDIIKETEKNATEQGIDPVYYYQGSARQKRVDFTDTYRHALNELGMSINEVISDEWKDLDMFDRIYLVGGSAFRVKDYIEVLVNPESPKDPGLSNVEGYYNFGVSKMVKNNKE